VSALESQLLVGAVGGLVAALVTSGLTFYAVKLNLEHATVSDRLADARKLRDGRRERLRGSIETVLHASLLVSQVVSEDMRIWQTETVEERDARHATMLNEASVGINEARVSLMIQSVTKELIRVVDEDVLTVFERYKSAYMFDRKFPGTDAHNDLGKEYKLLQAGVENLRAEVVRVLDEMEKPI
jgi:vacuolar-type H+-ATPase catalytic subunit A/Vma1